MGTKITELPNIEYIGALFEGDIIRYKTSLSDGLAMVVNNTTIFNGELNFVYFDGMRFNDIQLCRYVGIKRDQSTPQFELDNSVLVMIEDEHSNIYHEKIQSGCFGDNYYKKNISMMEERWLLND